jgi:hypothetical protein
MVVGASERSGALLLAVTFLDLVLKFKLSAVLVSSHKPPTGCFIIDRFTKIPFAVRLKSRVLILKHRGRPDVGSISVRFVPVNRLAHWSKDVAECIACEIQTRCDIEDKPVTKSYPGLR